jgi:DNA helicase-2/ATP-dependent DNA helicase PcrA
MKFSLNPEQQRAVEQVEGRVLILAGAGSGKTRVLTYRMAHLIINLGVSPKAILGLTFTNKAAAEMRHRLHSLVPESQAKFVTLSTFHSFCLELLREDISRLGYTREFTLYNEHDVNRIVNAISRDMLGREGPMPSLAPTMALLSHASSQGLKSDQIHDHKSLWHQNFARTLHGRLMAAMRAYNAVDFDSLLSLAVQLLEEHADILNVYQERYKYIMVDEYQDTNPIQYRLTDLLAKRYNNLCVVGDDDQSIYGWRGADMNNILNFQSDTLIKLEQNYRSTSSILHAANSVISCNTLRHDKKLWSLCGEGEPIELFSARNELDEANAVVERLVRLKEHRNLRWQDMAILYRSNSLSRQFEIALTKHKWKQGSHWVQGIPYRLYGAVEFYERREVKDLFAYLRVVCNPSDQEALLRIINQPRRGIGEAMLDHLTTYNREHRISLWRVIIGICEGSADFIDLRTTLGPAAIRSLENFVDIIATTEDDLQKYPWDRALCNLVERIDYKKAIHEEVKSPKMREFKWENVQEFINAGAQFYKEKQALGQNVDLSEFTQRAPLEAWKGDDENDKEDKVHMLTFHSSKGLEFPACFLVGIEEGIIPHTKSLLESGIEEERRLMYVAITRAMKHLTISMSMSRLKMGKEESCRPSPFLREIPQEVLRKTDPKIF